MERLTFRNAFGEACYRLGAAMYQNCIAAKLAEYEDAEEQGLLARLPCRVGESIYHLLYSHKTKKYEIIELKFVLQYLSDFGGLIPWYFLTREEAEQALNKLNHPCENCKPNETCGICPHSN